MVDRTGTIDVRTAVDTLAARLPGPLAPLAALAYDYRWSWTPCGDALFSSIDPHRWELTGHNPVRLLQEATKGALDRAAADASFVEWAATTASTLDRPSPPAGHPVAFFSTEFAVHGSLPIYAGGLGILAGDVLKEASDRRVGMVGVGILYRQGYFHQRIDASGWQHEYWTDTDPELLPAVLVRGEGGPLTVTVRIRERDVVAQIWRVDVGSVPLFLLDAHRPENQPVDRWITSRLYIGDRGYRLAQYALLGIGGMRALTAMGIEPSIVHLNEGHVALAPLELARELAGGGQGFEDALSVARSRTVFTTHTPVAAGNEAYTASEVADAIDALPEALGVDLKDVLALGRADPHDGDEPFGMTPLGIRVARTANAVSRKHGEVARSMWRHLFDDDDPTSIIHVTNGVHAPTWMAAPMRGMLDRRLGEDWIERIADPSTWNAIDAIPDSELWAVRVALRTELVAYVRERAAENRLGRGEPIDYVEAATRAFDPDVLTVGFARRATGYKRMHLLVKDPGRALRLLAGDRPIQLVLAGKPHPQDEEGKRLLQHVFELKWAPHVADRVAYLEDYEMEMARRLVAGCDVWVNVPRPPLEACGTSGMKAALNGVLNCSVLDGWWDEAYDGTNGWAIASHPMPDVEVQDSQDASALYDIIEQEAIPSFYDRDEHGVPHAWCARIKASLKSIGPRFNAARMLDDYVRDVYRFRA